jgi:peptide/nickel transport system substrate-binding protein/oligopeptide transport system substrate-binding protein
LRCGAFAFAIALLFSACPSGGRGRGRALPREGGVLRLGVVGLKSLDPAKSREPTEVLVADQLFDTLVRYEPAQGMLAGLASSWETPDPQTWVFHLDANATFADGAPITAADVKFTLDRISDKRTNSPLAAELEPITGFRAAQDGSATGIVGVEVSDPHTVTIRLDASFTELPAVLAHPGFGIVEQKAVTAGADKAFDAPVGSGPFRFLSRTGRVTHLVRFRAHRPAARLDGLDLVSYDQQTAAYDALNGGRLDAAPIPPERVRDARKRYGTGGIRPYFGVLFYGMNVRSPKLSDARLRKAIVLAVDRQRVVHDVYQDTALRARGVLAQGLPGIAQDLCKELCPYDAVQAKKLVAEAYPNGGVPEIQIDFDADERGSDTQARIAREIKASLDAVGIPSALRPHPFADYGQFVVSGQQELFRLGWIADYPSGDAFLYPLFVSNRPDNLTGFSNGDVDFILRSARAELDPVKRAALFSDAEHRILDQYVALPIAQFETRIAARRVVRELAVNGLGSFDGTRVWIAPGS